MEYQPENKKWEDWVFDDKDHALVIEFEIRPDAGPFGLVIGSKIFRRHRPTTRSQNSSRRIFTIRRSSIRKPGSFYFIHSGMGTK